jgi:hypothetical protein
MRGREDGRMKLYSDFGGRRTYQILGDVAALVVIVLGIVVAVSIHNAIASFKRIGSDVTRSGTDFSSTMSDIGKQLGGVPFLGSGIRAPFDAASHAGTTLSQAGTSWQNGVEGLATLVGWTVALLVVLVVLVGWVRPRLVGAVRRGAVARLLGSNPDLELLAFRALANSPATAVARVAPAAVEGWRRGDPEVIRALAALELKGSGIRLDR